MRIGTSVTSRLTVLTVLLAAVASACGSSTATQPELAPPVIAEPEPEPPPPAEPLGPVPHDGPLEATPGFYDCGVVPELQRCEFDVELTHSAADPLIIESFSQDVSPWAAIGLVQYTTGFDRDLPYSMADERLRLLFSYRRDDPTEEAGGSLFVRYRHGSEQYRLEIPVRVE